MKRSIRLCLLILALLVVPLTIHAAKVDRVLTDVSIDSGDETASVHIGLEGNNGQRLGRVYYEKQLMRVIIENARLAKGKKLYRKSADSVIAAVAVKQRKRSVSLVIRFRKKMTSILEHLVFTPGISDSVITVRKDAYYEHLAEKVDLAGAETKVIVEAVAPKAEAPQPTLPDLPEEKPAEAEPAKLVDLVVPKDLEEKPLTPKEEANSTASVEERKKTLAKLLGDDTGETVPKDDVEKGSTEVASIDSPAAKKDDDSSFPIGIDAPDLSGLYMMAAIVLIIGGIYFLLRRGRPYRFDRSDEPITMLKTKSLGGKMKLMIIEVEGKRLLLGSGEDSVQLIAHLDPSLPADTQLDQASRDENVTVLFQNEAMRHQSSAHSGATAMSGSNTVQKGGYQREQSPLKSPKFFSDEGEDSNRMSPVGNSETSVRERLRKLRGNR